MRALGALGICRIEGKRSVMQAKVPAVASAMAKSKGVNLPAKLSAVCGETEIEHGT